MKNDTFGTEHLMYGPNTLNLSTFGEHSFQELPEDYMQSSKTNKINWYYNSEFKYSTQACSGSHVIAYMHTSLNSDRNIINFIIMYKGLTSVSSLFTVTLPTEGLGHRNQWGVIDSQSESLL